MIGHLAYLLANPAAFIAFLTWPTFSVTSFRVVSSLKRQGIVPATVIDAGANVGQFAVACAKIFSNVAIHSFEPLPSCLEKLKRCVVTLEGITLYPLALGAEVDDVRFHVNSYSPSSSILSLSTRHRRAFPQTREVETITVNMSTLDREMDAASLKRPVLLKLDVQGYEPQVLEGAGQTLRSVDYVLLEASFRPLYEGEKPFLEIVKMMEERGFEFLRPVDWLSDSKTGEVLQLDALFVSKCRDRE